MRTETKVIQVANTPSVINDANASHALWGWSVQSVQITDRKTVYDGDTTGYVDELGVHATTQRITETVNYATITYVRDLDDPNTPELRRLEQEYASQTAMAAAHLIERSDVECLGDWPEEKEWYREYQDKRYACEWTFKGGIYFAILAVVAFVIVIVYPKEHTPIGELAVVIGLVLLVACGSAFCFWKHGNQKKFLDAPQTKTRLAEVRQHIEEAQAQYRAKYDEAMAARAAIVRQAQAITGV